ncbi:hypothetical protein [Streptomyces zagrosensis]|uniref:Uncharacterized protein n=1 Tax=Streptomyces zagrosensis TaxID=1042984 RepID=A0A7W9V3W8_9ACTN|nr:hypothetical protein [Streptomyces zagrosensis]MBB5940379.1 hypothetical protein [Streptomyces zagrosensis]
MLTAHWKEKPLRYLRASLQNRDVTEQDPVKLNPVQRDFLKAARQYSATDPFWATELGDVLAELSSFGITIPPENKIDSELTKLENAVKAKQKNYKKDEAAAKKKSQEALTQENVTELGHHRGVNVPSAEAQNIRYAVRRAVSTDSQGVYQQSLNFELIDDATTPAVSQRGRAVRISTAGTILDTARMRMSFGPTFNYMSRRFEYDDVDALTNQSSYKRMDTTTILHAFCMNIQPVTAIPDNRSYGTQGNSDWLLAGLSPTTRNQDKSVSVSTSVGVNLGFFGDTPTAGVSYSYTTGSSWMLPDYELTAAGATTPDGPYAAWAITRTDKKADPLLARSALLPYFEAVFCLRPDAKPQRYSAFATRTTLNLDQRTIEPVSYSQAISEIIGAPFSILTGSDIKLTQDKDRYVCIPFYQSYVIDWETGHVTMIGGEKHDTHKRPFHALPLMVTGPFETSRVKQSTPFLQGVVKSKADYAHVKKILSPPVAAPAVSDVTPRFQYRGASPVGLVRADYLGTDFEVLVPEERLVHYVNGFTVGSTDKAGTWSHDWLPGKRALRIRRLQSLKDTPLSLWISPRGYQGGLCTIINVDTAGHKSYGGTFPVQSLGLPEVPDAIVPVRVTRTALKQQWSATKAVGKDTKGRELNAHVLYWRDGAYGYASPSSGKPGLRAPAKVLRGDGAAFLLDSGLDTAVGYPTDTESPTRDLATEILFLKGKSVRLAQANWHAVTTTAPDFSPITKLFGGRLDVVIPHTVNSVHKLTFIGGGKALTLANTLGTVPTVPTGAKPVPFAEALAKDQATTTGLFSRCPPEMLAVDAFMEDSGKLYFFHAPGSYLNE